MKNIDTEIRVAALTEEYYAHKIPDGRWIIVKPEGCGICINARTGKIYFTEMEAKKLVKLINN